jgi:hypothetical protein
MTVITGTPNPKTIKMRPTKIHLLFILAPDDSEPLKAVTKTSQPIPYLTVSNQIQIGRNIHKLPQVVNLQRSLGWQES